MTAAQRRQIHDTLTLGIADTVSFRQVDGFWQLKAKKGFFYRHGQTADGLARQVMETIRQTDIAIPELVSADEHWHAWPKDSYFEAVIRLR